MKFFDDKNGFTQEEVKFIMQATDSIRQKRVANTYSMSMDDKSFLENLTRERCGYFTNLIRSEDRSIFLFSFDADTPVGDSRDRYLFYYKDKYYFLSTGFPEFFIYGGTEQEEYSLWGYDEPIPARLLKYTEKQIQKIREKNQHYDQNGELVISFGISFYVETPINPADKFYLQDLLREMLVIMHAKSSFPNAYERAYIEEVNDYGVNTVSVE